MTNENSFSTAAILKEYAARYMSGSPSASKFALVLFARWMEALSSRMVVVLLYSESRLSSSWMRLSMKSEKVSE